MAVAIANSARFRVAKKDGNGYFRNEYFEANPNAVNSLINGTGNFTWSQVDQFGRAIKNLTTDTYDDTILEVNYSTNYQLG